MTDMLPTIRSVDPARQAAFKHAALTVSREATDLALQAHGGYGYFQQTGVERFYRDVIALEALLVRPDLDLEVASTAIFGRRSGYL